MSDTLESMRKIRSINSFAPYTDPIRNWKEQGRKVIGFECTYVPEEIIYAAGMLAVRLHGDPHERGLEEATAYMYTNTCSFIRSQLELVLEKKYHFLDGSVLQRIAYCAPAPQQ